MAKLESIIKSEITRLAKHEVRSVFRPLRKEVWGMKLKLSNLNKNFNVLDRLTRGQLQKVAKKELDEDDLLLELAFRKAHETKKLYQELELGINPLVIIQLPNDDQARKETIDKSKLDIVKDFLKSKGVKEHDIAIWLSEEKENLETVDEKLRDFLA